MSAPRYAQPPSSATTACTWVQRPCQRPVARPCVSRAQQQLGAARGPVPFESTFDTRL